LSNEVEAASTVVGAIHSVWEDWSHGLSFRGERPEMQHAFAGGLSARLPDRYSVSREARLPVERKLSAWRLYDIAIREADRLVGLIELSYWDTNVPHALHNGELKLLGNCAGLGTSSGRSYADERGFTRQDLVTLNREISGIPVRGLFFVNPGPKPVLDREEPAIWWETRDKAFAGETRFWSALTSPEQTATLRQVFAGLAGAGVNCWFYSLCGEDRIEALSQRSGLKPAITV
jgi:hypothetical protein